MAGGGPIGGSSGRRRTLDADLNLVPFIDLLSVCISFLLMTAVWLQIGTMQVKQSHGTEGSDVSRDQYEMELKFVSEKQLDLVLKRKGKTVKSYPIKGLDTKAALLELDTKIKSVLPTLTQKGKFAVKDVVATGMITPKAGVDYGSMVAAMDVLRENEIKNLGIVPVKD